MRPLRTPSEQHAIDALKASLVAELHDVREIPEITDRPDAAFVVDGRTVAVECRTFTSERLLRLHGLNQPEGKVHQIYLPLEPHVWIREAILAKEPRIPEYAARCNASAVWLVTHSARGIFSQLTSLYAEGLSDLFHMAVTQTPHSFERIYITGEDDLPPVCIFSENDDLDQRLKYSKKNVICIPVRRHFFARVTATEGPNGQGQISIDLHQPDQVQILLQPLDRRFSVDYSQIRALPTEQVAQSGELSMLYAEPIASKVP